MAKNFITIKKTGKSYDFIASVKNETEDPIKIIFTEKNTELSAIKIKSFGFVEILADADGELTLAALENGSYTVEKLDPIREALLETADNLGWNVIEDESGGVDFRKGSPAGEDLGIYVHPNEDIIQETVDYALNFDKDEHIAMWIEGARRGVSGVPSPRELVQDADDIQEMLDELSDAFVYVRDNGVAFHPAVSTKTSDEDENAEEGFRRYDFRIYLEKSFSGFENPFLRELVNNVIDYGLKHENVSKDQLVYWLCDMIPEVEFGEVAFFMNDDRLTAYGLEEKNRFAIKYNQT